jgi:hypothetical protein
MQPPMLIINDPSSMSTEPSTFRKYGLGAHDTYKNPMGTFLLELLWEPITTTPPSVLLPTPSPKLNHNQTGIIIVDVKDLRQTIGIEMGYGETNAWLEWIKYSFHTLNKYNCYACAVGRWNPRSSPSPWDGPQTLLAWYVKLPFSKKGQPGPTSLGRPCHYCSPWLMTLKV